MRRIAALLLAGAIGIAGTAVTAGPAGAGMQGRPSVDGLIKLKGITGFVGDGIIGSPAGQALSTAASPAQKAIFVIRVQNEKFNKTNRIEVWADGDCLTQDGVVTVTYNGQHVAEQLFEDELVVGNIPPGGSFDLRAKFKMEPGAVCFVEFGMASQKFSGPADFVVAEITSTQGGGITT